MLTAVNVDAIGIGYNFGLHLQDQGFNVNLVNVGESAHDSERFANLKAEYYWGLRECFEQGRISGLMDETTIGQLATIRYRQTATGKTQIESKDDARKRGVKSPDRAEAVMLAYADCTPGIIGYYREQVERNAAAPSGVGCTAPELESEEDDGGLIEVYRRALAEAERR
jgi:hypothetical protein